jgi:hypothetical protein
LGKMHPGGRNTFLCKLRREKLMSKEVFQGVVILPEYRGEKIIPGIKKP